MLRADVGLTSKRLTQGFKMEQLMRERSPVRATEGMSPTLGIRPHLGVRPTPDT